MPRRKRLRKIVAPPGFQGFKPYGHRHGQRQGQEVDLHYEEYEAIKLEDYDMMNQEEASKLMGVSRATFARIYESARRKIALALVETREIRSVFGNAVMDNSWLLCNECHSRFSIPAGSNNQQCPLCKSTDIKPINE